MDLANTNLKVKANTNFTVHFIGGGSHEIREGDIFDLVATYVSFPHKETMAVIHIRNAAPFGVYLKNLDIV